MKLMKVVEGEKGEVEVEEGNNAREYKSLQCE